MYGILFAEKRSLKTLQYFFPFEVYQNIFLCPFRNSGKRRKIKTKDGGEAKHTCSVNKANLRILEKSSSVVNFTN